MNDDTPTYRLALKDSSHPFYEATWLIFAERMNTSYAAEKLAPQKEALIPYLFEIVDADDLRDESDLGQGYAPPHAITLLGEWEVTEAAPRLLEIFENEDHDTLIWSAAVRALEHMGPGMVDEMFALMDRLGEDSYDTIAGILSKVGKGDSRVYDWLEARFLIQEDHWDVRWYAECLLACDHERATPLLEDRIKKRKYDANLREILQGYIEEYQENDG